MIYMLVEERLPKVSVPQYKGYNPWEILKGNVSWALAPEGPPGQQERLIVEKVFEHIDLNSIRFFREAFLSLSRSKRHYLKLCGKNTSEEFLKSDIYQGWKNRKARGPSLLYATGAGKLLRRCPPGLHGSHLESLSNTCLVAVGKSTLW